MSPSSTVYVNSMPLPAVCTVGYNYDVGFTDLNDGQVQATADASAKIREGMVAVRILDGIVQNVYSNNPGKHAAWLSAKHVEKDPQKKGPPTP